MADLVSGGAEEMVKYAIKTIKNGLEFGSTLQTGIETVKALSPLLEKIKSSTSNDLLDRPRDEDIVRLETKIRGIEELVEKSKKIKRTWWKSFSFPRYQAKLQEKDEDFQRHLAVHVQMMIFAKVTEISEILMNMKNLGQNQNRGLCGAPVAPHCMGMDDLLTQVKIEMMKKGVSVRVLTGLGGSGKTTLAKKLCSDPEIKGKFGGNIFFVTVSKTPDLKIVAQTLFEHCRREVPKFQNDEDTINQLELLLKEVGSNPILLVLDDVWPGSESLVEKFKFEMPDYKILVTSRDAFTRFGTPCKLDPLDHDHAVSLFHHFAELDDSSSSYMHYKNLVHEIVKGCKGSPLALQVIGGSLCQQPFEKWQSMMEFFQNKSILESKSYFPNNTPDTDLLGRLQESLDSLENNNKKNCFIDIGLFPDDQGIPVTVLIDMWTTLYNLDEDGKEAMAIVHDLKTRNLINVITTRKVATETDMYYNSRYVMMHDLLRDLAILQSKGKPFEQRKRLIIHLNGDDRPDWWIGSNQQGMISRVHSFVTGLFIKQKQLKVAACILSISTDETFSSDWCDMQPDEAKVLILNLRSDNYSLPDFTKKMNVMPNLVELSIDYCKDLIKLPDGFCNITKLKKLSITNCHNLSAMPQDIKNMVDLEVLRLCSCSDLKEMPEFVAGLNKLRCLDISDCVSLPKLPDDIGHLQKLEKLSMKGCSELSVLPDSVIYFGNLNHEMHVICDEEGVALWEQYPNIPNIKIYKAEVEINLNWLHGTRS
ncbi:putative disease resistance protein [Trifolium pratense]|uniref:Putative disease resistance protein n=1 Tax=Trifolium pratense TaxID=57577 RepID=A0A2K3PQZ3_TRIPR|nr:putative disease resistance protein [Trifolium pratense]